MKWLDSRDIKKQSGPHSSAELSMAQLLPPPLFVGSLGGWLRAPTIGYKAQHSKAPCRHAPPACSPRIPFPPAGGSS